MDLTSYQFFISYDEARNLFSSTEHDIGLYLVSDMGDKGFQDVDTALFLQKGVRQWS